MRLCLLFGRLFSNDSSTTYYVVVCSEIASSVLSDWWIPSRQKASYKVKGFFYFVWFPFPFSFLLSFMVVDAENFPRVDPP